MIGHASEYRRKIRAADIELGGIRRYLRQTHGLGIESERSYSEQRATEGMFLELLRDDEQTSGVDEANLRDLLILSFSIAINDRSPKQVAAPLVSCDRTLRIA